MFARLRVSGNDQGIGNAKIQDSYPLPIPDKNALQPMPRGVHVIMGILLSKAQDGCAGY